MGLPAPYAPTLSGGVVLAAMLLDAVQLQIRQRLT